MAFSLNEFRGEIRAHGTQPLNSFQLILNQPEGLQMPGNGLRGIFNEGLELTRQRQISLRCVEATFPGMSLMTKDDVVRFGYGPVDKTVHGAVFSDITTGIILDSKGLVLEYFNKWHSMIINTDSSDGMDDASGTAPAGGGKTEARMPYEINYKDNYATTLQVIQLDTKRKKVIQCTAHKAFPLTIGDISMRWDSNDSFAILPVTFSYRDHKVRRKGTIVTDIVSAVSDIF